MNVPQAPDAALLDLVNAALADLKAVDVRVIDARDQTTMTDHMVIASGTSDRHVRALAENVVVEAKHRGFPPIGVEGESHGEWVLVDLGDVIVHVMQPRIRDYYNLERFWAPSEEAEEKAPATSH